VNDDYFFVLLPSMLLVFGVMVVVARVGSVWGARRWAQVGGAAGAVAGATLVGLVLSQPTSFATLWPALLPFDCTSAWEDALIGVFVGAGLAAAHVAEHLLRGAGTFPSEEG
jgi:hypothetical protein